MVKLCGLHSKDHHIVCQAQDLDGRLAVDGSQKQADVIRGSMAVTHGSTVAREELINLKASKYYDPPRALKVLG